jgi:hypothetical protein
MNFLYVKRRKEVVKKENKQVQIIGASGKQKSINKSR